MSQNTMEQGYPCRILLAAFAISCCAGPLAAAGFMLLVGAIIDQLEPTQRFDIATSAVEISTKILQFGIPLSYICFGLTGIPSVIGLRRFGILNDFSVQCVALLAAKLAAVVLLSSMPEVERLSFGRLVATLVTLFIHLSPFAVLSSRCFWVVVRWLSRSG